MPRGAAVDTPTKAQISRRFQELGGVKTPGAATATANEFKLRGSGAASKVLKYDKEIVAGSASRKFKGRQSSFSADIEEAIDEVFADDDTQTYREAAKKVGVSAATLFRYAT